MLTRRRFLGTAGRKAWTPPDRMWSSSAGSSGSRCRPRRRALADLLKADAAEWSGLAKQTGFTADS